MPQSNLIEIGTVLKPHGIVGAVAVRCSPDHVGVFAPGLQLHLRRPGDGNPAPSTIAAVRGSAERPILEFDDVADRDAAESIRGASIMVDRDALPPLGEDEFFHSDLEGCEAWAGDRLLGRIQRVLALPANDVLVIAGEEEVLVPLTRAAVPLVDVAQRRIEVDATYVEATDA